VDDFEREMMQTLEEDEEDAPPPEPSFSRPISLNQFVSTGGELSQDEDDYSSSDYSDEE